jgi:hypothetical protein
MCRPCLYTAHVYRDDVTIDLGRYYIYDRYWTIYTRLYNEATSLKRSSHHFLLPAKNSLTIKYSNNYTVYFFFSNCTTVNTALPTLKAG